MNRISLTVAAIVALILALGACDRKKETADPNKSSTLEPTDTHEDHEHHNHSADKRPKGSEPHRDEHAGHDHHGNDESHEGKAIGLGVRDLDGYTVKVKQFGYPTDEITELVFEIEVEGAPPPGAIRVSVRNTAGDESLRVKASKVGDHSYDAHVTELPTGLKNGGVVVFEIERGSGSATVEFEIQHN